MALISEPASVKCQIYQHTEPFHFFHNNAVLPHLQVAYETWGELNPNRSNALLLFSGVSLSSHARSNPTNPAPGWWQEFVGPDSIIDTNKYFVVCANHLGSCFGSTGPSSVDPASGQPYATSFPVLSISDLVRIQFHLLDHLGIKKLYACVGASLGGMCALQAGALFADRMDRLISISACRESSPTSIACNHTQRKAVMLDPNWKDGCYYGGPLPVSGMQLAREIATISYRSGPEWRQRFGRKTIEDVTIGLHPTFMVEQYLEHQGRKSAGILDPNTLLYLSKAMDLFGLTKDEMARITVPVLIVGITSDALFPVWQQREVAHELLENGTPTTYFELPSLYGHDTSLFDKFGVGAAMKGFLETTPTTEPQRNTISLHHY